LMQFDLTEFAGETIRLRFVVVVTQELLHGAVDGVQIISGRCGGKPATAVGTDGDDTFELGTAGKDVILGLGGDDVIKGRAKKDVVCGGSGNDDLRGGGGKDRLFGGPGKDDLKGGAGEDDCKGGGGRDDETSC
ncbi:MAG: calcium-binding protein, partial [Actinomycetota bacterium]